MKHLLIALTILLGLSSTVYAGGQRGQERYYGHHNNNIGRYEQGYGGHQGYKRPHHIKKHHNYYNKHKPYYVKKHHHKHHRKHGNWVIINSAVLGFLLGTSY